VNAVTTRSKGTSEDNPNLREAIREYRKVERATLTSSAALEAEVDTKIESKDLSLSEGEDRLNAP
jgi:hypothetical protein